MDYTSLPLGEGQGGTGTSSPLGGGWEGALYKWQWDQLADPAALVSIFEKDEAGMAVLMPDYFGQPILTPKGRGISIHEEAVVIQNSENQTIAFVLPDEEFFFWNDIGQGYFKEGGTSSKYSYTYYVEDKYNRKSQPISWGIYLAARDLGDFSLNLVDSPVETTKAFAQGVWKIVTLQFDIEKTWERIISADRTDAAYVVSTVLMGYLAGPKGKKLIPENDALRFEEFLGEVTTAAATGGSKLTWQQVLVLFKQSRQFEALVHQHLLKLYPVEQGYKIFQQVYLKVDGVMSIADDLIYNTTTGKFILNETKYGVSNTLRKNQRIMQEAIKQGKEIEIRSTKGLDGTGFKYTDKITTIEKILRSNSIDGTITNNTIQTIWTK